MGTSIATLSIEKGDTITLVEYNGKSYIHTSTHSPFTADSPATFFDDSGSGVLVNKDLNPIEDFSIIRVHLSSITVNNNDTIFKTDGKLFHAIL